ncbi:hypothetical protein V2S04_09815 [Microbacterium sp. OR21]|uniref:hypothetical protein n=1 Tax=Microbacterium sp. OR21 TaxID=3095346 RepID=UPI0039B4555D
MSALEARYRRLLQWYPRPWREQNGEVLIGTALDAAEAEGRTRPAAVEILQMALHGIAERATVRVALVTAIVALLCASATQVVLITSIGIVAQWGVGWLPLALGALSGILQTLSLLALLTCTGRMRPGRLVPIMLTASAAWALAFLTAWSWSVGIDRADAGLADTAFSGAFTALLGAGWALGGAVITSLVLELTHPLPRAAGYAAAGAATLVFPPVIGMTAVVPLVAALTSLALVVACVRMSVVPTGAQRSHAVDASARVPAASPTPAMATSLSRGVGLVALACAVLGAASAAFAVAGSALTPTIDSTRAMQLGLAAGALTGIPLLWIAGVRLAARFPAHRVPVGGAIALLTAGVLMHAVDTLSGAASGGEPPWAALAPVATGVGLLVWVVSRVAALPRLLLAGAVAVAALVPLWPALVASGFLSPAIAGVVAVRVLSASRVQPDRVPSGPAP